MSANHTHRNANASAARAAGSPSSSITPSGLPLMSFSERFRVGELFGPYRIVEKLGEGSMGAVFKALHTYLDRLVAIKVLSPALTQQPAVVARFEQEMKAVGKLDDPRIVQAMNAGEVDGTHFLAMEFVQGENLMDLVNNSGTLSIDSACAIVRQAALGLRAAHSAGIVHRDIKPANLMLSRGGGVKILDLGLALLLDDADGNTELTPSSQSLGTPNYMAPEQWDDPHGVDGRADLYALGCTLYFLLVGSPPYGGEQYRLGASKMEAHLTANIPDLQSERKDAPPGLVALFTRLLAKSPDERIPTAGALADALANYTTTGNQIVPIYWAPAKHHLAHVASATERNHGRGLDQFRDSTSDHPLRDGGQFVHDRQPGLGQRLLIALIAALFVGLTLAIARLWAS